MMKVKSIIIGSVFMILSYGAYGKETIHITSGEFPPDYSEKYKFHGLVPHIVTEAFALVDIDAQWKFLPWVRAKKSAQHLKYDASCCWAKSAERLKHFVYSDPVQSRTYVFFHLKTVNFDWDIFADLKDIDIGATIGYTYGQAFGDAEKDGSLNVERAASDEMNLRRLLAGRIKILASNHKAGYATAAKIGVEQLITHHPKPLYDYQISIIISKEHKNANELLKKFNLGLEKLKTSGRYDQILEEGKRGDYIVKND
jgi:polar amino acid transport system substrate-binding protein